MEELYKLFEDYCEMHSDRVDCHLQWFLKKCMVEQMCHLSVSLLTIKICKQFITTQFPIPQKIK